MAPNTSLLKWKRFAYKDIRLSIWWILDQPIAFYQQEKVSSSDFKYLADDTEYWGLPLCHQNSWFNLKQLSPP